MKVAVYSFEKYDDKHLVPALKAHLGDENVKCLSCRLLAETSDLAAGCDAVCIFVNDRADEPCIKNLARLGVKMLLLRSAGFNHVDLVAAAAAGISVRRVPAYSPFAVAEMAVGLLLALVRKIPRAYDRVRNHNFSISGLEGFDIRGKTIGIVGTGKIGQIATKILSGFSPGRLIGYDVYPSEDAKALGLEYCSLEEVLTTSDILSLHLPLLPDTYHIIGKQSIARMKKGVVIVNVSRGGLVDASAVIQGLKSGQIGGLAMDVYENEQSYFFSDCSDQVLSDDVLANLLTYPNVIITAHQAFLTSEALECVQPGCLEHTCEELMRMRLVACILDNQTIASTTLQNLKDAAAGTPSDNECKAVPKK